MIRSLAPEQTQAGDDSPWLGRVEVPGQPGVQLPRVASSRAADGHCDGPPRHRPVVAHGVRVRGGPPWFGSLQERTYVEVVRSLVLPMLTPELVLEALNLGADLPESQWDPLLRNWIQGRLSPA